MALVLEDGTGLSNSNAYTDNAGADVYHADRPNAAAWALLTNQDELLVAATDFLKDESLFPWRGTKKTHVQALAWPRTGAQERHGPAIPDNEVPARVANATAELAFILSTTTLHPVITRSSGDVRKERVDVIETEYFSSKFRTNNPEDYTAIVTSVMGLLYPLLRSVSTDFLDAQPFVNLPTREEVLDQPRPLIYDGIHENT